MLRIKGWSAYQSYKDRRPPWIRLHKSLLDNFKFHKLSVNARALLPMLWLLASEDEDPVSGCIRIGYEEISFRLRMPIGDLKRTISEIIAVKGDDGGHEFMEQTQPIDNELCNDSVTDSLRIDEQTVLQRQRRDRGETDSGGFEDFWTAYPKRAGQNPKKPALEKYQQKIRDGAKPEEILTGAKKYAVAIRTEGKEKTGYVAQALTWLNQERWKDEIEPPKPTRETLGYTPLGVGG